MRTYFICLGPLVASYFSSYSKDKKQITKPLLDANAVISKTCILVGPQLYYISKYSNIPHEIKWFGEAMRFSLAQYQNFSL